MGRIAKFVSKGFPEARVAMVELGPDHSGLEQFRDEVDMYVDGRRIAGLGVRGGVPKFIVKKDELSNLGIELEVL